MNFKKTFNRSERAAILALGELYKQDLVGERVFDFQTEEACMVMVADRHRLQRTILLKGDIDHGGVEVFVNVYTLIGQGYSDENPREDIVWTAEHVLHSCFVEGIQTTRIFKKLEGVWVEEKR